MDDGHGNNNGGVRVVERTGDQVGAGNGHMRNGSSGSSGGNSSGGESGGIPGGRGVIESPQQYGQLVQQLLPSANYANLLLRAFVIGGTLSLVGQFVLEYFTAIEPTEGQAIAATLATMIFIGAMLTAVGVYDYVGEVGGLGAAVPITGFSNAIVSAAMDFRREGFVLGMGSKMFIVAGPVIVFGLVAGMIAGGLAWLFKSLGG